MKTKKIKIYCPYCNGVGHKYVEFKASKKYYNSPEIIKAMQELREEGFTYQLIGSKFKITRQRAHQIIKKIELTKKL